LKNRKAKDQVLKGKKNTILTLSMCLDKIREGETAELLHRMKGKQRIQVWVCLTKRIQELNLQTTLKNIFSRKESKSITKICLPSMLLKNSSTKMHLLP